MVVYLNLNRDFDRSDYEKTTWFRCPCCFKPDIRMDFSFCPKCGAKIVLCDDDKKSSCQDILTKSESF